MESHPLMARTMPKSRRAMACRPTSTTRPSRASAAIRTDFPSGGYSSSLLHLSRHDDEPDSRHRHPLRLIHRLVRLGLRIRARLHVQRRVPTRQTAGQFAISASNNAPGWPSNPGRSPVFVNTSGWYRFEHVFRDNAGVLAVDLNVYSPTDTLFGTWTLSDPADMIPTVVGGHRYGWFVVVGFEFLAIDDVQLP